MYQNGMKLKIFVKEQNGTDSPKGVDFNINKYLAPRPLTGEKAKAFYENILRDSLKKKEPLKPKPTSKPQRKTVGIKIFKNNDLLWMAQNNDIKNLKLFFSQKQNYDVNITDEFGWTPLMCACCSGAEQAVQILLENGADIYKCDRLGNNAMTLAKQKNKKGVVKMLENFEVQPEKEEQIVEEPEMDFFCSACKENFKMNKSKHESSTLHLFNCKIKTRTFYGIPESNKGFQLLLRKGWDKEKGLGVNGKGRKYPIKTIMKKDRTGIGAPPPKNVSVSIGHTEKYESKKQKIYRSWKDKNFEKNFRMEFS